MNTTGRRWLGSLAVAIAASGLVLAGCQTPGEKLADEDADVAARCTPVKDLLSKNYHREGKLDLAVVSGGAVFRREGVILSPDEAARIAHLDRACRAWVKGALTDDQYAQAILPVFATTLADTANGQNIDQLAASNKALLDKLKEARIVPDELRTQDLNGAAKAASLLPPDQRYDQLAATLEKISGEAAIDREAQFRTAVIERLDRLEGRLGLGGSEEDNPPPPPPPPPPQRPGSTPAYETGSGFPRGTGADAGKALLEGVDLYFSTGSAELTYDGRQRLRGVAGAWARNGQTVSVIGYADSRGKAAANQALSKARAETVAGELSRLGVRLGPVRGDGVKSGPDHDLSRTVRVQVLGS